MSKQLMQFPSGISLFPDDIKPLIKSLQDICTARNIDLRTVGRAKAQHIIAQALGCHSWHHLLDRCSTNPRDGNKPDDQEKIRRTRFVLTKEEKTLLMESSTGRWVIDEVDLFNDCWKWLKAVESYAHGMLLMESEATTRLRANELPDKPAELRLKSLEVTPTGVRLETGGKPRFTVNLAFSVSDDMRASRPLINSIEAEQAILTFHTWTSYSMVLPKGDDLDCVIKAYEREIADALEAAEDW